MSEIVKYNKVSNVEAQARRALEPTLLGRAQVLVGAGFLVIMAGIVIPLPESLSSVIDIGWIITVCMSGAVLILSVMAKNLSELSGFASFIVSITLIRLGLAVASVKSIIIYQSAGSFIEKTGSFLLLDNLSLYAVVIPVAVLGGVVIIFMATGGVIRETAKYASDTLPFKYISAEADFNASVISQSQAADIKRKIKTEANFFLSMSATGRFLRFDAVVNVLIIILASLGILRSHAASGMGSGFGGSVIGDGSVEVDTMLTLGLWAVIFSPAIVLAFSSSSVVNKKILRPVFVDEVVGESGNDNEEMTSDGAQNNKFELLNPDFAEISEQVNDGRRLNIVDELANNIDGKVESAKKDIVDDAVKGDIAKDKDIKDEDAYSDILNLIVSECQGRKVTAFLCAESVDLLAVTTAVNIGVELADSGKKCLLIDADTARGAVYKVFDIDNKADEGPFDSCVDGLAVWSVSRNCKAIGSDLTEKISEVGGNYDCVIIYAPNIEDSNYYGKLAGFVNVAGFAIGSSDNEEKYILELKELLASVDCKCIVRDTLA